ncbi:hypothetical protein [Polymorphospora sp. NPDC050346]|uniref:hypothetical protein n=1 Tax=Polymorphospora sp. NPDC050346 TaxID=3155780 RepID=UPI0033C721DE
MTTTKDHAEQVDEPIVDTDDGDWRTMLDKWGRHQWHRFHRHRADEDEWPPPWGAPMLTAAAILLALLLLALVVIPIGGWVLEFARSGVAGGAGWLRDWAGVTVVLDPVREWTGQHAGGLPVGGDTLWWTWAATGVVFFLLACTRAVGARIGWTLFGAATVAMVYDATTGTGRPAAAAIAALWWVAFSLPAFRRSSQTPVLTARLPDLYLLDQRLRRRT